MIRLTLQGMPGFDGIYDLDFEASPLTNREHHWIKEISGVRLGEFEEAADAGDNDILVSFALIALVRYGRATKDSWRRVSDMLWDMEGGKITVEEILAEEPADAEDPPAGVVPETTPTSGSGSDEKPKSPSDNSEPTGGTSPESSQDFSGDQNLEVAAESPQVMTA